MPVLLFFVLLALGTPTFAAEDAKIHIDNAWAAETPPTAMAGAVYLDLVNPGATDRLIGAAVDDAVAGKVELHTIVLDGTVMRMREVEAIDLAAESTTTLEPGSLHIMLIDLKQPLRAGESFPLTLEFEKAGAVVTTIPVRKREEMMPEQSGHGNGHGGHSH